MSRPALIVLLILLAVATTVYVMEQPSGRSGTSVNSSPVQENLETVEEDVSNDESKLNTVPSTEESVVDEFISGDLPSVSNRQVFQADSISLPLTGSAPATEVKHTIPIEEIRQGCFRQDCIPSIDTPTFITPAAAELLLQPDSIGIALVYKGVDRFYPFPMLESHELVNDVV